MKRTPQSALAILLVLSAGPPTHAQVVDPPPAHALLQKVQCGPTDVCGKYSYTSRGVRITFHPPGSPRTVLFEETTTGYFDNFGVSFWLTGGNDPAAFDFTYVAPATSIFALYPALSVQVEVQGGNGAWTVITDQEYRPVPQALWSVHSMDSTALRQTISGVESNLGSEAAARAAGDAALAATAASEAATRGAADSALAAALADEVSRAESAEGALSIALEDQAAMLDGEIARAMGAEAGVASSIAAETARAQAREAQLGHTVNGVTVDSLAGAQAGQVLAFTSGGHLAPATVASAPSIVPTPPANPMKIATLRWWTDKRQQQFQVPGSFVFDSDDISGHMVFDGSQIWITDSEHGTLIRMRPDGSPNGSAVSANVPPGFAGPVEILFDGNYLWTTAVSQSYGGGGYVNQFVASSGAIVGSYQIPVDPGNPQIMLDPRVLGFDGRNLWVAGPANDRSWLCKIDQSTSARPPECFDEPFAITSLAFDGVYLWAAATSFGKVHKIDVTTNTVVASYAVPGGPVSLTFDGANMWTGNLSGGVSKIRASDGQHLGTFGSFSGRMVFDGASVWVVKNLSQDRASVTRLRASDGAVIDAIAFDFTLGAHLSDIVFDGISVWLMNVYGSNNHIIRL